MEIENQLKTPTIPFEPRISETIQDIRETPPQKQTEANKFKRFFLYEQERQVCYFFLTFCSGCWAGHITKV